MSRLPQTIPLLFACALSSSGAFADDASLHAARESITASDLFRHVDVLADDTLEGRAAGTRGGIAASHYIVAELREAGVTPAGPNSQYLQPFSAGYHNVLAELPGMDPTLAGESILVGAHFDHVGYGTARTSYGPLGYIHNGADDNASGVATLLELAEALVRFGRPMKRSVVFAFWDGEEQGLLGSRHWMANPTVSVASVKLAINLDMVGRLRNSRLIVGGTRTGFGLRKLAASRTVADPLQLEFDWELKANSDHWPFLERAVPIVTLFTGLHDDYHRPSDDVERINSDGMQLVSRYLLDVVERAANAETLPTYRAAGRSESAFTRRQREALIAAQVPRLGVSFQEIAGDRSPEEGQAEAATERIATDGDEHTLPVRAVRVTGVRPGSAAAAAGLAIGDEITAVGDATIRRPGDFAGRLLQAPRETTLSVLRGADDEPESIDVTLAGRPTRLGISWRADDAEPNAVFLTRVVPGSPAAQAGVRALDRIYAVNGESFTGLVEFGELVAAALTDAESPIDLTVETNGRIHDLTVRQAF